MLAAIKETSRQPASGLKADLCQGFRVRRFKRPLRERENKRQEEACAGRQEAGQPCRAEMSQGRVTHTGASSLITEQGLWSVDAMKDRNFWIFYFIFYLGCAFVPAALLT